jgi:hypothetical protein
MTDHKATGPADEAMKPEGPKRRDEGAGRSGNVETCGVKSGVEGTNLRFFHFVPVWEPTGLLFSLASPVDEAWAKYCGAAGAGVAGAERLDSAGSLRETSALGLGREPDLACKARGPTAAGAGL